MSYYLFHTLMYWTLKGNPSFFRKKNNIEYIARKGLGWIHNKKTSLLLK